MTVRTRKNRNKMVVKTYFDWLVYNHTDFGNKDAGPTYLLLSKVLYERQFLFRHIMDENRLMDGVWLRKEYKENVAIDPDEVALDRSCSVLEMLIAISKRMEYQLSGMGEYLSSARQCMFLFICNLGLEIYSDEYLYNIQSKRRLERAYGAIDDILTRFIEREYDYGGDGGIFPLREPKKDQRETELWYQMCAYLLENYNFV